MEIADFKDSLDICWDSGEPAERDQEDQGGEQEGGPQDRDVDVEHRKGGSDDEADDGE